MLLCTAYLLLLLDLKTRITVNVCIISTLFSFPRLIDLGGWEVMAAWVELLFLKTWVEFRFVLVERVVG